MHSVPGEGTDVIGPVHYNDVNAMVRLGQRQELEAYFRQFAFEIAAVGESDIALARSRFISLVSVLVASVLEIGAPPEVEKRISDAANIAQECASGEKLSTAAMRFLAHMTICATPNANRMTIRTVEKAKRIIAERFQDDITDEAVAEEVGLSRSHFRYLFRELTGLPFGKYLTEFRLNEARRLLETEGLPVKVVFALVGYSDSSGFFRAYRSHHGVAPSAHRVPSL
jgi:AraC-like DNA-binding protein